MEPTIGRSEDQPAADVSGLYTDGIESTLLRSYQELSLTSDGTASRNHSLFSQSSGEYSNQQPKGATKVLDQPISNLSKLSPARLMSIDRNETPDKLEPTRLETLQKIDMQFDLISKNLTNVLDHLHECTSQATQTSIDCLQGLKESVNETCNDVDANIKSMYKLIAKCDEINKSIKSVDVFANEVRQLKRQLDIFESSMKNIPQVRR